MISRHDPSRGPEEIPRVVWTSLPTLSPLSGPTIPAIGRRFFSHSPTTILKLGVDDGEDVMTALAHSILGYHVPRVLNVVTLSETAPEASTPARVRQGLILIRLSGTPLSELWPELPLDQRKTIKARLCELLVRMRAPRFDYYGRPIRQPYVLASEFGSESHAYCTSRTEWDDSRIRALHAAAPGQDHRDNRARALERVQRETGGVDGWDRPVLTHGDLSDRNVLVDPDTLEVTGLVDWETANVMPAYFEYVAARLSGGHLPEWRKELLDVLREVLRRECGIRHTGEVPAEGKDREGVVEADGAGEERARYQRVLAAWDAAVDVERIAQGYGDDCAWTFETAAGYQESA